MPTFTGKQLSGEGTPGIALIGGTQYTFVMVIPTGLSGSGYFSYETIRNADGFYDGTKTHASGAYADYVNVPTASIVSSSFIASIATHRNPPTAVSFKFTPANDVPVSESFYRSTGNIGLELNPS